MPGASLTSRGQHRIRRVKLIDTSLVPDGVLDRALSLALSTGSGKQRKKKSGKTDVHGFEPRAPSSIRQAKAGYATEVV